MRLIESDSLLIQNFQSFPPISRHPHFFPYENYYNFKQEGLFFVKKSKMSKVGKKWHRF